MFQASLNGKRFKEFIQSLSTLVDEAVILVNPTGMYSKAVDPANVALVDVVVSKEAFEKDSFKASDHKFGIGLKEITDLLELIEDDDTVYTRYDEETQNLVIDIAGMSYSIALLDTSSIRKPPVTVERSKALTTVVIRGIHLKRGIKAAEKLSDYVFMECNNKTKTFVIKAVAVTSKVSLKLGKNKLVSFNSPVDKVKALFDLDYLSNIVKVVKNETDVTLELAEGVALMIQYPIADKYGMISYYLAPRVES